MTATVAKDMGPSMARLLAPSPSFRHFIYDERKVLTWAFHLLDDPLYVEDYARDYKSVLQLVGWFLFGDAMNLTYEIGGGGGVLTLSTIIPGHKCKADWYMWNKRIWGPDFAREARALVDMVMAEFNLKRIWSSTANPRIAKFVKGMGGTIEGVKKQDFLFDGKLHDNYMLAYTNGGKEN